MKVPSRVVENHVEFDESWIFTLVAPCVPAIFALHFFQSYLIDCLSEQVWVALVSFLIDRIEIPR